MIVTSKNGVSGSKTVKFESCRQRKNKRISVRRVRTVQQNDDMMQSKSCIRTLGHFDPQIGTYRTNGPTTSWAAVQVAVTLAANLGLFGEAFDVSQAFLVPTASQNVDSLQSSERWSADSG